MDGRSRSRFDTPVHPHVRGENDIIGNSPEVADGSPPRAWGKSNGLGLMPAVGRFTPTCVGKIAIACKSATPMTVHPHVRGENTGLAKQSFRVLGSPPRAWGKSSKTSFL